MRPILLAGLILSLSVSAMAELGGDVSSVKADQQRMSATRSVSQAQAYSVHEIHTPANSVVREYVSPNGKVFAVSYRGQLLGEGNRLLAGYSEQIAPLVRSVHQGQHRGGPVTISLPGVVYHVTGHMRSYSMHAYLPGNVPQGVAAEELQ